jgi:hypothetical protein
LGGYAFLWGNKQEGTATWFGMMLPTGEPTGAVDALAGLFGKTRKNRAPIIGSLSSAIASQKVRPGTPVTAHIDAADPDGDPLTYRWILQEEQTERGSGGDNERPPQVLSEQKGASPSVSFVPPKKSGGYRIFVFVTDGKGNGATGNIPFFVE